MKSRSHLAWIFHIRNSKSEVLLIRERFNIDRDLHDDMAIIKASPCLAKDGEGFRYVYDVETRLLSQVRLIFLPEVILTAEESLDESKRSTFAANLRGNVMVLNNTPLYF